MGIQMIFNFFRQFQIRDLQSRAEPTAARSTTLASDPGRRPGHTRGIAKRQDDFFPRHAFGLAQQVDQRIGTEHEPCFSPVANRLDAVRSSGVPILEDRKHPVDQCLAMWGGGGRSMPIPCSSTHWREAVDQGAEACSRNAGKGLLLLALRAFVFQEREEGGFSRAGRLPSPQTYSTIDHA